MGQKWWTDICISRNQTHSRNDSEVYKNLILQWGQRMEAGSPRHLCTRKVQIGKLECAIEKQCLSLCQTYKEDIDILNEIKHLKSIHKTNLGDKSLQSLYLLNTLRKTKLVSLFPNITIAIRLFCCIPVSVSQGERSFSAWWKGSKVLTEQRWTKKGWTISAFWQWNLIWQGVWNMTTSLMTSQGRRVDELDFHNVWC